MKKISQILVVTLTGISLWACKPIVNHLAFHPNTISVIQENELPQGIEELVVVTEDNVTLRNLYLPAPNSDKVLVYFHGNGGNIYHRIPSLLQLRNSGVNVIGVSYRGYGRSEGSPSEDGIYQDGKAVYKHAQDTLGFTRKNIVIVGRSIGSTAAVDTAQHENIGGLILITPLTSGRAHTVARGLGLFASLAGNSFDNLSKMNNISSPLLIIHGTNDYVVPFSMGEEIYAKATSPKQFIRIEDGGHNDLQDVYPNEYWSPIFTFIKKL